MQPARSPHPAAAASAHEHLTSTGTAHHRTKVDTMRHAAYSWTPHAALSSILACAAATLRRAGLATLVAVMATGSVWGQVTVHEADGRVTIANDFVKIVVEPDSVGISQTFFAAKGGEWVRVAEAFRPPSPRPTSTTELYLDRSNEHGRALRVAEAYRIIVSEVLDAVEVTVHERDQVQITLSGTTEKVHVQQTMTLRAQEASVHIDVRGELQDDPPRLEYLLSPFAFAEAGAPDFTHLPAYKRSPGDVVGDRAFFSPAAIVQKGGLFAAIVPDVDKINAHVVYAQEARPQKHRWIFGVPIDSSRISLPAVLDLELVSGMTNHPLVAYGMMDVITEQHVYWRHENAGGTLVRTLSNRVVRYGMDLLLAADAEPNLGYRRASRFLWERYGSRHMQRPRPQAMPLADYATTLYPASFSYKGYTVEFSAGVPEMVHRDPEGPDDWNSWQEWEMDDLPVGMLRLTAPQWFHLTYNTAWWNNMADASGLYYWGQELGDAKLIDKARRIVNLTLTAPQSEGLFPALYDLDARRWKRSLWQFPSQGYDPDETRTYWNWEESDYHTASASVTAGYLMEFHRLFEKDPRILTYVRRFGDFLIDRMEPDGSVPAWFDEHLVPRPSMRWNAEGGANVWVLSELYRATGEEHYLSAATRAALFLINEVLPTQRWVDFEALYSCAVKAETFFDERTGQPPRNAMAMSWALQGFVSLFETSGDRQFLDAAVAVADYASLLQTVWAPHYIITAYPFGGFSSQIGDAEWLDQRDHRFAGILVRLGLLAGRQDLMERGVAAARSSLTLVTHPRHVQNGIYNAPTFPLGLGPENIDHEGFPQTPLRSGPSWAEVGGLMAAADVLRLLGGLYVDVERGLAVGVDGLAVRRYALEGQTLTIEVSRLLSALPVPYEKPYRVHLKVEGLPDEGPYDLVIGNQAYAALTRAQLADFPVEILP